MIDLVKKGNESAFDIMFKKYLPIVLNQRNRYFLKGYDLDDWLQEGRIIFYQSIEKFDSSKNVTFGLFFKINFERHIISLLRYQQAKKRKTYLNVDSLDETEQHNHKEKLEDYTAKTSLEYVFVREVLEDFPDSLSKLEIQIYYCVLRGENLEEISQKLNKPLKKVKSGYNRIKKKIRDEI